MKSGHLGTSDMLDTLGRLDNKTAPEPAPGVEPMEPIVEPCAGKRRWCILMPPRSWSTWVFRTGETVSQIQRNILNRCVAGNGAAIILKWDM